MFAMTFRRIGGKISKRKRSSHLTISQQRHINEKSNAEIVETVCMGLEVRERNEGGASAKKVVVLYRETC